MTTRTPRTAPRRWPLAVALLGTVSALGACGSDGGTDGGADSARGVVDAHIEASHRYDLEAACELLTPERREEMALFDGEEIDGYCATATADIVRTATPETKSRTKAIYTDPEVSELDRPTGTWYRVEAADGSYAENIEVVETEGAWWIAQIESEVDDEDHDH